MRIILLLHVFAIISFSSFSQDYIYSFEGTVSFELLTDLEKSITKVTGVKECKIKLKENTNKGEIFLFLDTIQDPTNLKEQFTPVDVKRILLENNLTPIQFIESK